MPSLLYGLPALQRNLERFRENFRSSHEVIFPEPVHPLVNELVLVEDYVTGTPMSEILKVRATSIIMHARMTRSNSTLRVCLAGPLLP